MSKDLPDDVLDAQDRRLLRLLQDDGSLSSTTLADNLAISVSPCWRRRKRLEKLGVIRDYQANLDRQKLGFDVLAYVQVHFDNHAGEAPRHFEQLMSALPNVLACHKVTGEADYILTVLATDLKAYGHFVEDVLRGQRGVLSIQSSLVLREIKAVSRIPIPD